MAPALARLQVHGQRAHSPAPLLVALLLLLLSRPLLLGLSPRVVEQQAVAVRPAQVHAQDAAARTHLANRRQTTDKRRGQGGPPLSAPQQPADGGQEWMDG